MDVCVVCCREISDMRTEDIKIHMDKKDRTKEGNLGRDKKCFFFSV
jgi:hypothetical protein